MIVTSFTLRSPCSWKLQCEMYVLQFCLNLFSVALAQLRLALRCRCIDASTSTPPHLSTFTSSHAHIRRSTSPPHHTHTSAHLYHLYHICTSTLSLLHICPVFLSFFLSWFLSFFLSFFLHIFSLVSVHLHLRTLTSTDLPLHLHTSTHLYRTCTSTLSLLHVHPFFLSFYISFPQCWTITCPTGVPEERWPTKTSFGTRVNVPAKLVTCCSRCGLLSWWFMYVVLLLTATRVSCFTCRLIY